MPKTTIDTTEVSALLEELNANQGNPAFATQAQKRARWLAVSNGSATQSDYLPIMVEASDPDDPYSSAALDSHVRYSLAEQIETPERMLAEWLPRLRPWLRFPSDAYVGIAPRFGNAFLLTGLGIDVQIMGDTLHPSRHLNKDEARALSLPPDFMQRGLVGQADEYISYCRQVLPESIHTGLFFMMSPFDLAYLIRGQDILIDMYDDPDLVHHLMSICTELFVQSTRMYKQTAGEPDDWYWYDNRILAGGGHSCEDCCVMISPSAHAEFSIPYTKRALDALGGGWVHFCGDGRQILDNYLAMPNMHGICYGQIHLNGDPNGILRQFEAKSKGVNYTLDRNKGEPWLEYFRRFLKPLTRKACVWMTARVEPEEWHIGPLLMDLWHQAQDEKWPGENG